MKIKLYAYSCIVMLCSGMVASAQRRIDSVITASKLKEIVYYLASDSMKGRLMNGAGCDSAAQFIAKKMETAGLKSIKGMEGYLSSFGEDFKGVKNVMGMLKGTSRPNEIVVVSAHYDHLGTTEGHSKNGNRDVVYNGANDDASGVAVMLSLANYFAERPHQRTILFVAFSGEETGMWGSRAFSTLLKPTQVTAQINLEMLGRTGRYKQPFITGHWYSDLREVLNKAVQDSLKKFEYFKEDNLPDHNLFFRSDNLPLAKMGIPAHTIMLSTDLDVYYHTLNDEPATLDYTMMSELARNIAVAITPLIDALVTPGRINIDRLAQSFYETKE